LVAIKCVEIATKAESAHLSLLETVSSAPFHGVPSVSTLSCGQSVLGTTVTGVNVDL